MTSGRNTSLVDSNILVYVFDPESGPKQHRSIEVLGRLFAAGTGFLSLQVLGEFYNAATRRIARPLEPAIAALEAQRFAQAWRVFEPVLATVLAATRISTRYQTSYWDGLIIASALECGANQVLTEDMQSAPVIEGVRILNPLLPEFDFSRLD